MRSRDAQSIRFSLLSVFVLSIVGKILLSTGSVGAKSATWAPCSAPEYHEFDFWIADWDSFDFGKASTTTKARASAFTMRHEKCGIRPG